MTGCWWGQSRAFARSAMLACGALVVLGCPQRTAVWLADGSTARRLVFRLSDERDGSRAVAVGGVRVDRCDREPTGEGAEWLVGPRNGTEPTRELTYGVAPPGWETDQGPRPLTPGCYQVTTSGTGRATFDVAPDGRATERPVEALAR